MLASNGRWSVNSWDPYMWHRGVGGSSHWWRKAEHATWQNGEVVDVAKVEVPFVMMGDGRMECPGKTGSVVPTHTHTCTCRYMLLPFLPLIIPPVLHHTFFPPSLSFLIYLIIHFGWNAQWRGGGEPGTSHNLLIAGAECVGSWCSPDRNC